MRLGLAVEVVLDLGVVIDVVEARFVVLATFGIVADDHARRLDQAGLDGVVQAEVADDPAEQRFLAALLAGGSERRGGEVVAGQNAARACECGRARRSTSWLLRALL